jgi:hypothetical protein
VYPFRVSTSRRLPLRFSMVALALGCARQEQIVSTPPAKATAGESTDVLATSSAAPPPISPGPPVDPKTIVGYVRAMAVPEEGRGDGTMSTIDAKPIDEHLVELRFAIRGAQGPAHAFRVIVPKALPVPFAVGERVSFRAYWAGGGPKGRGMLRVHAADGSLLLAVGEHPEGWTIESGRRVKSENQGDYIAHEHEVVFEHGGAKRTVAPGKWGRLDAGGASYHVWGSSVERTRTRAGRAPLDYSGGWLDFAMVRAR